MAKQIRQFRFFGDQKANFNKNVAIHQMSTPTEGVTLNSLTNGDFLEGISNIIQLGIQSLPGTKFYLNDSSDEIIIGMSGIYEIDLENTSAVISTIKFSTDSLTNISIAPNGYLIIDIAYQEG